MGTLMDEVESVVLVQECRGLEEEFGTTFTDGLIGGEGAGSMCVVKGDLREIGWKKLAIGKM